MHEKTCVIPLFNLIRAQKVLSLLLCNACVIPLFNLIRAQKVLSLLLCNAWVKVKKIQNPGPGITMPP